MSEYLCPCCQEGHLLDHLPEGPDKPYTVECPVCGTWFHHSLLYDGANGVHKFLMDIDAERDPIAENWAEDTEKYWQCSRCNVKRKKVDGDPPFTRCPDCGELVYSWR